jgi:hypothetical protein
MEQRILEKVLCKVEGDHDWVISEVRDKRLEEVPRDKIGLEKFLEDWLEQDIST